MIIKNNDKSLLRYEKDLPCFVVKPGHVLKARLRARYRQMFLHGHILTEDNRLVEIKTDDYLMAIYSIYIEESKGGLVTHQAEFLCGTSAHDPIDCWQIIRRYDSLPFQDIEGILEENEYPDHTVFDKKCKSGLSNYARYNNIIPRTSFNTALVDLIEATEIDHK